MTTNYYNAYISSVHVNSMNNIFKLGFKGYAARKEYELIIKNINNELKFEKQRKEAIAKQIKESETYKLNSLNNNTQFRRVSTYNNFQSIYK